MVETRRLFTFMRIIDIGSLTRAADVLRVAQPALSQQMQALEAELGQPLLVRSRRGVQPTAAGDALYRHAQVILRQWEDAVADVRVAGDGLTGSVSVGLAPYSNASLVAGELLAAVREKFPQVRLRITDNFGAVLSEAMMTGRLDLAILYDRGPIRGVNLERLYGEPLALMTHPGDDPDADGEPLELADLGARNLLLPGPTHTIRQVVTEACEEVGVRPRVVAEVESVGLVQQAVESGLGDTILPHSLARRVAAEAGLVVRPLPELEVYLSLGTPAALPRSEPAQKVHSLLREILQRLMPTWLRGLEGSAWTKSG